MNKQAVLLFSGYNIRAVVAFCRWASAHQINFHIAARDADDPIFMTDYGKRADWTRTEKALATKALATWADTLRQRHGYTRLMVLPSTEFLNRFLLDNRQELEEAGLVIPLPRYDLYQCISDKQSFANLCNRHGLSLPEELDPSTLAPPFVAKPKSYASSSGIQLVPQLVSCHEEMDRFFHHYNGKDFFFQEFVHGRSLYLFAYLDRQHRIACRGSQENLIQQADGGSVLLAREADFHQHPVADHYLDMLRDEGFRGLIMIEVRHDTTRDRFCMIEANPRLWGPMQFMVDNHVALFENLLADHGFSTGIQPALTRPRPYYFWSGGFRSGKPVSYHNFSADHLVALLPEPLACDLFSRPDSLPLFHYESHNGCSS